MKYYKKLNESGEIVMLLTYDSTPNITDPLTVEMTEEEYAAVSAEWSEKAKAASEARLSEQRAKTREIARKAKAYDIITGVSE